MISEVVGQVCLWLEMAKNSGINYKIDCLKALLLHLHTIDALQNWESNIKLLPESLTKMFF